MSEYQHNLILCTLPFRWLTSRPSQRACGYPREGCIFLFEYGSKNDLCSGLSDLFLGLSIDVNGTIDVQLSLCEGNRSILGGNTKCSEDRRSGSDLYYAMFLLGMIIAGIGYSPLYSLGVPYMDQNVKRKNSPMYLGIFVGFGGILGKIGQSIGHTDHTDFDTLS